MAPVKCYNKLMTIRTHKFFLPTLLIFQMLFIFTMSSFGHTSSDAQSNLFVDFIAQNFPHVRHGLENNLISLSTLIFLVRKTAHFTEYAILGSLFFLNLRNRLKSDIPLVKISKPQTTKIVTEKNPNAQLTKIVAKKSPNTQLTKAVTRTFPLNPIQYPLTMSILFSFLYACTDELHQIFVPGRSAQFRDILIDTLGASFGATITYLTIKLFAKIKTCSDK